MLIGLTPDESAFFSPLLVAGKMDYISLDESLMGPFLNAERMPSWLQTLEKGKEVEACILMKSIIHLHPLDMR